MGGVDQHDARPGTGELAAQALDAEGLLFRAALLAGYGRDARGLARRFASAVEAGDARSCLDAGSLMQLTVDAPGPPGLRVGVRLGERVTSEMLAGFMTPAARRRAGDALAALPAGTHPSLGAWLFWTEGRQSVFVDLRDPSPADAFARLNCMLTAEQRQRLDQWRPLLGQARPWVLRLEAGDAAIVRLHVHFLVERHGSAEAIADALAPGSWPRATQALEHLLKHPVGTGRWVVVVPLDDCSEPALRVGHSGWVIVPEDDRKHRALGAMVQALGGPRDYAEALWSLCRSAAPPDWRVGRACELRIGADSSLRARFFLTPHTQGRVTAGTNSSAEVMSWTGPATAAPSSP